jgi:methylated-DNA-protein-cysteine methyltransferase related protein
LQDNYFHKVYAIVLQIPEGKVCVYAAIGKYLGSAKSARMVGWALNKCQSEVPAHRVVNKQGLLTGKMHFDVINLMQDLLENEGVEIKDNQIIDLEKYLWEPKI